MGLKRDDLHIGDEFEYCGGYDHTNDCLGGIASDPFLIGNTYRLIEFSRTKGKVMFEAEEWRYDGYNEWWIDLNTIACYFIRRYRTIKVF